MITPPTIGSEARRLETLRSYAILDTDPEQAYDDLTRIAAHICDTPIALVSLVDADRQWFKSRVGLDATETPRDVAFCAHAIGQPNDVLVVPDALVDERFHDNPLAIGSPHVRFYAGAPLVTSDGLAMGTLCVIDHVARELTDEQRQALQALSRQVVSQLELRRQNVALLQVGRELESANRELRHFTAFAAHDLREPLNNLVTLTDLVRFDLGEDASPSVSESLGWIHESVVRMGDLVSSFLQLSDISPRSSSDGSVELATCVQNAIQALGSHPKVARARIERGSLPVVHGDRALLTQLLQNLIENACKFSEHDEPRVELTAERRDGMHVIGVRDDGIGLSPEQAESIFAPLKRVHAREVFDGVGLGLTIARKVVERHGGRIWVDSTPGQGCHFQFTLPDRSSAAKPAA